MKQENVKKMYVINNDLKSLIEFMEKVLLPEIDFESISAEEKRKGVEMIVEYFKSRNEIAKRAKELADALDEVAKSEEGNPTSELTEIAGLRELSQKLREYAKRIGI